MRNIGLLRLEREGGKEEGNLPYSTIASQIDMKFICQTINLFGCHSTIAKHANLFARPETLYTTLASKQAELSNTIEKEKKKVEQKQYN